MAVVAILALAAAAGIGGTAAVLAYGSSCDLELVAAGSTSAPTRSSTPRTGRLLGSIPAERNREPVTAEGMSLWMRKATIAIEDRRFFNHGGVDLEGIARAAVADIKAGSIVEGGSTITQQLVRNLYISREQTVQRKVKEACLASKLDGEWSKQRILTEYLNQVYYGNHAYGIEAAAQTYFSKPASELDLVGVRAPRGPHAGAVDLRPVHRPGPRARASARGAPGDARHRRHHAAHLPQDARTPR